MMKNQDYSDLSIEYDYNQIDNISSETEKDYERLLIQNIGTVADADNKSNETFITNIDENNMKPYRTIVRGSVINDENRNNN